MCEACPVVSVRVVREVDAAAAAEVDADLSLGEDIRLRVEGAGRRSGISSTSQQGP
jgi:hypothetical protein